MTPNDNRRTRALRGSPIGRLVPAYQGEPAFVPEPLPREIELSLALVASLDRASRAVAMLAGIGETLPNPHLLIRPFLRKEAVLSSRIEGTHTSLSDLFLYEASGEKRDPAGDAREVANYVRALEYGLERLHELPLSVRLLNELHGLLMKHVRGADRRPGELRTEQVWIGESGTGIGDARFIPPPPDHVRDLLSDLERFMNEDLAMPPLIRCALIHYQFEAIHPYFDGNGRIGRLLIVLYLCEQKILPTPLLYLSAFFERHRQAYYDELFALSATGDWGSWLQFFLRGVEEQAQDAIARSRRLRDLHESYRRRLQEQRASAGTLRMLDELMTSPVMTPTTGAERLGMTWQGAKGTLERLRKHGIVWLHAERGPLTYVARELLQAVDEPVRG